MLPAPARPAPPRFAVPCTALPVVSSLAGAVRLGSVGTDSDEAHSSQPIRTPLGSVLPVPVRSPALDSPLTQLGRRRVGGAEQRWGWGSREVGGSALMQNLESGNYLDSGAALCV